MKILGNEIFAKDAEGRLLSRIGTLFFRTPGLVTKKGVHAMQRLMWIGEVNRLRAERGEPALTEQEEAAELAESVDLIFTPEYVLIRPDPERMDLALKADDELQALVPKRLIRYLNTSSLKVRRALAERGENWRMARQPISQEDMADRIRASRVAIGLRPLYYYNRATGTRFLTLGSLEAIRDLFDDEYRAQIIEIVTGMNKRNRLGQPEVDVFPLSTPPEIRKGLRMIDVGKLTAVEIRHAVERIDTEWRMSIPAELREESVDNFEWRNELCYTITREPNESSAEEQDLADGIAPEFYRQIEWLPGARIDRGEVIFDPVYHDESDDAESRALRDPRVKAIIFNLTRLFGAVDFINVGRIARSLARHPVAGDRRGSIYLIQYRLGGETATKLVMIRFQKWGVAERLDEGKDMLQAIAESDEYTDYILDRRLMCRQLGMNLPRVLGLGYSTEKYTGANRYNGASVRATYFCRPYVKGLASDKVPVASFRNPAFALAFAKLMGAAAALDLVVGRRNSVSRDFVFDSNYEVLLLDGEGMPADLVVTDHAGSFVDYETELLDRVGPYARPVLRRRAFVANFPAFAAAYADAFGAKLAAVQQAYRARRAAFDRLFDDRPYDTNGSGAFRWTETLARLDRADVAAVAARLKAEIGC